MGACPSGWLALVSGKGRVWSSWTPRSELVCFGILGAASEGVKWQLVSVQKKAFVRPEHCPGGLVALLQPCPRALLLRQEGRGVLSTACTGC